MKSNILLLAVLSLVSLYSFASEHKDESSGTHERLFSIHCDETGLQCAAVGEYVKASGEIAALSYRSMDGGHTWKLNRLNP